VPHRVARILQTISLVMLAWLICSIVGRWHWLLVAALVIFASSNVGIIWLHRVRPQLLNRLCRPNLLRAYCRFVGNCIGENVPADVSVMKKGSGLLLRSQRDFSQAAERGKYAIRGHDRVVDNCLSRVHENLTLRKSRRDGSSKGPLASFLLVGKEGIGKRYIVRVLSKLLFLAGSTEVFDCSRISASELSQENGILSATLKRNPFAVLLFENIESASSELGELLTRMLLNGYLPHKGAENSASVENTLIVFSTSQGADEMDQLQRSNVSAAVEKRRTLELMEANRIPSGLLNALTEILYCETPTSSVRAEVVALVMRKECREHGIDLCHIDAEILATQVLQIDDAHGFELVPQRAKHLLRKPLVAAADKNQKLLSLRLLEPRSTVSEKSWTR